MKVLFDVNVLISYLLSSEKMGTIATIVESIFDETYTLILPKEVVLELRRKIIEKEYLSQRIPHAIAERLISTLYEIASIPRVITESIPQVGRDFKHDYLLAYAVANEADYLVTGDDDLLVLKEVAGVKIVSPSEFSDILKNNFVS